MVLRRTFLKISIRFVSFDQEKFTSHIIMVLFYSLLHNDFLSLKVFCSSIFEDPCKMVIIYCFVGNPW
jgi:hypothetical protein